MTHWIEPQPYSPGALSQLGVSPAVEAILVRRGVSDPSAAAALLHPELSPSTSFPGVQRVVERILAAVRAKELICVWGDFDVDGQTSTAVLVEALRTLGAQVIYYVPIRSNEGHGIREPSLGRILDRGANLILTCDTGIGEHAAVSYANNRGVEVIITDHHDPGETLPDAAAVINPKLLPPSHPLADLSGVGVAYKLAEALLIDRDLDPTALLDLVALGLIADLALLQGETRVLAWRGIRQLRQSQRPGLRAIARQGEMDLETLTEEGISFGIAPRLNALGRLGDANFGVELLLSDDPVRASVLASQLEAFNTQRKLLTSQVLQAAEERISSEAALLAQPVLIVESQTWPGGVLGIVASRLVERYRKPAILLSMGEDGLWHGSARSIDGFHITDAIRANAEHLVGFGGHPMAAGLTIAPELLPKFRGAMQRTAQQRVAASHVEADLLRIDNWVNLGELSHALARDLEQLAPFGPGNAAPVFATHDIRVLSSRPLGSEKEHRKLVVVDRAGSRAEILSWNADDDVDAAEGDIAYSIRLATFQGQHTVALTFIDFHPRPQSPAEPRAREIQLTDLRRVASAKLPSGCLVWAEGTKSSLGIDRYRLHPAQALAILTAPPGRVELLRALVVVGPRHLYLVGDAAEIPATVEEFLTRLAGMTKFAIRARGGHAKVSELAVALAHRELSVRIGLEWLVAGGHLQSDNRGDDLVLAGGSGRQDGPLQHELAAGLGSLMQETAAYRAHFSRAEPRQLLEGWLDAMHP